MQNNVKKAYFAGGCFWGVEYYFQHLEGVIGTKVGYMGGHTDHPTYEEVCAKNTGHAETMEVTFDGSKTDYETLVKLFFEIHDPTQKNRQGRISATNIVQLYFTQTANREWPRKLIHMLRQNGYEVVTEVTKAGPFWEAEAYHQKYYAKNGHEPYCHVRVKRF